LSTPLPDAFTPDDPPNYLAKNTDLQAWQTLFQARRDWAFGLLEKSHSMSRIASKHFAEQATIEKGTQVAVGNHDAHIKVLEQKYQAAKEWFDGVEKEAGDNLRGLDADFEQLRTVPANLQFTRFLSKEMRSTGYTHTKQKNYQSLQEFLDVEAVKEATGTSKRVRESFGKRMDIMSTQLEKIGADYNDLLGVVGQSQSRSVVDDSEEPVRLYNEIDAVAKKVESDFEHVMGLEANPKSVAQVSKMALLHTRNFLPAIHEYSVEMSDLVRRAVEQKNSAIRNSVESMRSIANIESVIASMNVDLEQISIPQEGVAAFELISLVGRLPYIYGTLLVEAVRRREWMERIQKDSSSLAEEMATFQEEEERRRKRWLKPIADVVNLDAVQGGSLGFEMNVQPEKTVWPEVTRQELHEYLQDLQRLERQESEAEAFAQAIKVLDRPTKQQIKRAKNFKMGSVHEPAFGKGSHLMVRGDDELRVLKEANAKLEDELKGYKNRNRRLEDMMHRQGNASRLSTGAPPGFAIPSPGDPSTPITEVASPRPQDEFSRRSSVSSNRRFSTNAGQEDKRRIVRLEQELATEKEARAKLEKDAQARRDEDEDQQRRFEEAMSTKNNIMENMRAQQKEFADERKSLEDEIRAYKTKIEEAEDELDRVLGSRDHERTGVDARVQELVSELERARRESAEQSSRADERIEALQAEIIDRKVVKTQERDSLTAAFKRLSPSTCAPDDHSALIAQLEDLAVRSLNHQKELERAVAMAKSDNENAHAKVEEQEHDFRVKLEEHEKEVANAQEQLDAEKAKVTSITAELEEERGHLHDLRTKFAEGETGSEALRKRVEDEEVKVGHLQSELAEKSSHANSLDVELMRVEKKLRKLEEGDSSRTHQRMQRAKDLSQRLYTQHERLIRLLEALGFVITHEDGDMVLQRASKLGSSTVMTDTSAGLSRSTTTPSPTPLKRFLEDVGDLHFLQWTEATSPEEEDQRYQELVDKLQLFNIEAFSDAIAKRMRDMEHTARKWQVSIRGTM
jgi:autophagy-related protein 11